MACWRRGERGRRLLRSGEVVMLRIGVVMTFMKKSFAFRGAWEAFWCLLFFILCVEGFDGVYL